MNVINAARQTLEAWTSATDYSVNTEKVKELSYSHCVEMLEKMTSTPMSYGKLCRWLGWMQAACVENTSLTLEDMKRINMNNKDDK